jgi:hypothetical protein
LRILAHYGRVNILKKAIFGAIALIILGVFVIKPVVQNYLYNRDLKTDLYVILDRYKFVKSYKLSGDISSELDLELSDDFERLKFEDKQNAFKSIYEKFNESISSHFFDYHNIDAENIGRNKFVGSKRFVRATLNGKIYRFELGDLKIEKTDNKKPLGKKILSDDDILKKVQSDIIKNFEDVDSIKHDTEQLKEACAILGTESYYRPYNATIDLLMKDSFFIKNLTEQYKILSQIYQINIDTPRECGIDERFIKNNIWVKKNGVKRFIYIIDDNHFEITGLHERINRSFLEEDITILDGFDLKKIVDETHENEISSEINQKTNTKPAVEYEREPNDNDKSFAWVVAVRAVKERLKAPSTAKFPWSSHGQYIKEIGDRTFVVKSYVDAENSFGAKLRNNFIVKVKRMGGDTYVILDVQIDE